MEQNITLDSNGNPRNENGALHGKCKLGVTEVFYYQGRELYDKATFDHHMSNNTPANSFATGTPFRNGCHCG